MSAGSLCPAINAEFRGLAQRGRVLAEYVWIGGTGLDLRSKTKVLDAAPASVDDLPIWNYDGSSTGQAPGHDSEVLLKPVRIFADPFRGGENILVLCETFQPLDDGSMRPLEIATNHKTWGVHGSNSRAAAREIFENPKVAEAKPWYGIEQEYTLFEADKITPLGWPKGGFPGPQGPYYCSAGTENSFGRDIMEAHLQACLFAGVKIAGTNGEVMPGQWEYQVGPCEGLEAGDHMIVSRYIMQRVCEKYNVVVSFHPKPIPHGDWNGAGCHTNYSTAEMRDAASTFEYTATAGEFAGKPLKGGLAKIVQAIERLGAKHAEHIAVYGKHNELRLTGKHETASIATFKYGVANRGASIRIPRETFHQGYGYFEDRRPASNMDPYAVTAKIAKTTILNE
eukprot:m.157107 g.157107  ORF g.157107 m.157107 type:complete len:396 (+) comp15162_c0_seq1:132-1319(+)